jgi:hypothetical protein
MQYNNDGQSKSPNGDQAGVKLSLTNTGGSEVVITGVSVSSSGSAAELLEKQGGSGAWNREVFVDATGDGYLETGDGGNDEYQLGSGQRSLTTDASVNPSTDSVVYLYKFTESGPGNSGGPVSMEGQELTVTLYYQDGSKDTITFTG